MNWVAGHGLTYNPSEVVHGFTSPLNVLLLSLFYKLFGAHDPLGAIYGYRAASVFVLGLTGMLIVRLFQLNGEKSALWPLLAVAFFSLDFKVMLFSINGQEPAFTVFFLALGMVAILESKKTTQFRLLALAIAGLQWNRPEGFIYATGLLAGGMFCSEPEKRKANFWLYVRASLTAVVLYLPWIIFTTLYYGSPVPNTIYAKASAGSLDLIAEKIPLALLHVGACALTPPYCIGSSGVSIIFTMVLGAFSLVCLLAIFALPFSHFKNRLGSISAAGAFATFFYLSLVAATSRNYPWAWPFPWYYPPLSFCIIVGLSSGLPFFIKWNAPPGGLRVLLRCVIFYTVAMTAFYFRGCYLIRNTQEGIDNGVRKQVGLWLRDHVLPGQTVYCECIGYIGFYSRALILDYPGLTSRKSVALKRAGKLDFYGLLKELQPDWLALRETEALQADQTGLLGNYKLMERFFIPEDLVNRNGLGPNNFDGRFIVYKRAFKLQ